MLMFKRIITALVSFIIFLFIFYFAICIIGGAVSGGIAGAQNPENAAVAGAQAGAQFVQNNSVYIIISSIVLSGIVSSWLSFWGILPWCRNKAADN